MERKLAEALSSVEHLQPLGARSRDLSETASRKASTRPRMSRG
ncbi:hypothetical protein MGSAQ_001021 [marine sediment metagenome]|uniref:Uncharacterized protein n=1 Tax=marine sediment metagenome TaxID=412755 RepID=A0A1B6NVU5_9ZZZZ